METSKIKAYVLCREHINYFQKAKMELMQSMGTIEINNPHELSQTLKYYSDIEEFKNEMDYGDCIKYIKTFKSSMKKINKSMVKHWLQDNDKTIDELTAILESYEEHMRFFYESYGYLELHQKEIASDLDEEFSDYDKYLLTYYSDIEQLLYDLKFLDHDYMRHMEKIEEKFDLKNKKILGESKLFNKHIKILECSDVTYIQTSITFIARRNYRWDTLAYNWGDALTYIKAIERLRELVDTYLE